MIKRVLCLISGMNVGGAETFLMKVYRQLDKTQYQMDFCVNVFGKCAYDDEIVSLGGKIYRIPSKSENALQFKKQLAKIVKENKYDNVLRITSNAAGFWDLKIAKKAGATHTVARSSNSSDGNSFFKSMVHRICRVLLMKYVDVKIAPSDLAAIYTFGKRQYKKGNVSILRNGIDLDVYRYDKEGRKEKRKEFGIDDSTVLLGHIGRFEEQKNHSFLIDIFYEYQKLNKDSKLLLVGSGVLEKKVREKVRELDISQKVIFTGIRNDIPQILSAMDAFVFPSLYEGMPNTVIEAQATGLPCYISDTITKEADVTGNIQFISLSKNGREWSESIIRENNYCRRDTEFKFKEHGYDIQSVAHRFVEFAFAE